MILSLAAGHEDHHPRIVQRPCFAINVRSLLRFDQRFVQAARWFVGQNVREDFDGRELGFAAGRNVISSAPTTPDAPDSASRTIRSPSCGGSSV